MGGRITLIKSVLANLPVYYLSLFRMPVAVANKIEEIQRKFLLGGGVCEKRKLHLVKWKNVIRGKNFGGLGIGSVGLKNEAFLCKWWWRFGVESNALWKKVICEKHGIDIDSWLLSKVKWRDPSKIWKDILYGKNPSISGFVSSSWGIRVGNGLRANFWLDVWLDEVALCVSFPRLFRIAINKQSKISEMGAWVGDCWCWKLEFRRNLYVWEEQEKEQLTNRLKSVCLCKEFKDQIAWTADPKGAFGSQVGNISPGNGALLGNGNAWY